MLSCSQISLFFDLLLPMCSGVSEHDFVVGQRSGSYGRLMSASGDSSEDTQMARARPRLWAQLHKLKPKVGECNLCRLRDCVTCMVQTNVFVAFVTQRCVTVVNTATWKTTQQSICKTCSISL